MMARALASIRTISNLVPIEGADFIDLAIVDGWQCVVKKGEFQVGDLCIYFEIDSVLPVDPRFEFLRKSDYVCNYWIEGFRLRTRRFKKQIAQGLALPTTLFPEVDLTQAELYDVTELLNVKLWDPPEALFNGQFASASTWPPFLRKTEQERAQNVYGRYKQLYYDYDSWEISLKLDGSSMTVYSYPSMGKEGICSKNSSRYLDNLEDPWVKLGLPILEKLRLLPDDYCVQGELCGPGLPMLSPAKRNNREKFLEHMFFGFTVYRNSQKLSSLEKQMFFKLILEVESVPIIENKYNLFKSMPDVQSLLNWADGTKSINASQAEGFVITSNVNPEVSFKVISNKFLLEIGE
jgi:RNA ligase (TIGR02306 family)